MRKYNLKITRLDNNKLDLLNINNIPINEISTINEDCTINENFTLNEISIDKLPNYIDLRNKMPPIYEQGSLGSCTANALCALMEYLDHIKGSRLFLYYNERKLENDIPDDSGAELSDGIKCLLIYGICSESLWIYDINKFNILPPQECYDEALKHKALTVKNIPNDINSMKISLYYGFPFVVGISIYESFESNDVAINGLVSMPTSNEKLLGGHAVLCVGYDDINKLWIMRNSWGVNWSIINKGYFFLPYEYLLDSSLASDLWTIFKAT